MAKTVIVCFDRDLRVEDNPALKAALEDADQLVAIYIWAPNDEGAWSPGAASKWWLHQSLVSLSASLKSRNTELHFRTGPSRLSVLKKVITEVRAQAVYWNRRYEPKVIERDKKIKSELISMGIEAKSFNAALLFEPWQVNNLQKAPYRVFTPYYKTLIDRQDEIAAPFKLPAELFTKCKSLSITSQSLADLKLLPKISWYQGFEKSWTVGEAAAKASLKLFLKSRVRKYREGRDTPAEVWTSRLSPHLAFGEIGPRQIWQFVKQGGPSPTNAHRVSGDENFFLREVIWREFAYHLLYHFPQSTEQPLRPEFKNFAWEKSPKLFKAWTRGETGFPIVDAGMKELWQTGWMHNRVRMIVASFLVKDLLVSWQRGAAWFWDTLVDADLANNTFGWQWAAGCGADAAPFFRIFNPSLQEKKFDPKGLYVKRYVSHPSTPIVEHAGARVEALKRFQAMRKA